MTNGIAATVAAVALMLQLSTVALAQPATLPIGPLVSTVAVGGTAVTVFAAGAIFNYADIVNPPSATETLYVDITTTAVAGSGTAIPISPGRSYRVSGPIKSPVTAVAATAGHAFVALRY